MPISTIATITDAIDCACMSRAALVQSWTSSRYPMTWPLSPFSGTSSQNQLRAPVVRSRVHLQQPGQFCARFFPLAHVDQRGYANHLGCQIGGVLAQHFGCSLRLGAYIPADFRQIPPAAWIKTGQSVAKIFRSNILNETHIDGKIKLTA